MGGVLQHVAHGVWGSGETAPPSAEVIANQQQLARSHGTHRTGGSAGSESVRRYAPLETEPTRGTASVRRYAQLDTEPT